MHALAQDRVGFDALRSVADPVGELRLHQVNGVMPSRARARATAGRSPMRFIKGSMFFMRVDGGSSQRPQRATTMK